MRILTWNINGIRASKRSIKDVLDSLNADVICLQETKITRDMLDEPTAIVEGYNAYFSFGRNKKGYSGTANFCKDRATPSGAEEGLAGLFVTQTEGSIGCSPNVAEFDNDELLSLEGEGRAVITQHKIELEPGDVRELAVINVYVPRAAEDDERWAYKQRFLALLQSRAESLLRNGRHVIILGDINTTHKRIDHCDPSCMEFTRADSRKWINQLLRVEDRDTDLGPIEDMATFSAVLSDAEGGRFLDAFRFFYPDKMEAYTNWCTVTSARLTNYGKRLDYIFIDTGLQDFLVDCEIVADFEGSDHCPVVLEINCRPVPAKKCPPLCTKFMPEFQGKQQKLSSFFSKKSVARTAEPTSKCSENGEVVVGLDEKRNETFKADCKNEREKADGTLKPDSRNDSDNADSLTPQQQSQGEQTSSSQSSVDSVSDTSSSLPLLPKLSDSQAQESKTEVNPSKVNLKRTLSDKAAADSGAKKVKKGGKGDGKASQTSGGKQASLLNFFQKPSKSSSNSSPTVRKVENSTESVSKYFQSSQESSYASSQAKSSPSESSPSKQSLAKSPSKLPSKLSPSKSGSKNSSPSKLSLPTLTLIPTQSKPRADDSPQSHAAKLKSSAEEQISIEENEMGEIIHESKGSNHKGSNPSNSSKTDAEEFTNSKSDLSEGSGEAKPKASSLWKGLLSGPPPPPPCKGHREPCVLRTVKKPGPNKGKQFYVCARGEGHSTNKEARCDHFQWISYIPNKKK